MGEGVNPPYKFPIKIPVSLQLLLTMICTILANDFKGEFLVKPYGLFINVLDNWYIVAFCLPIHLCLKKLIFCVK